MTPLKVIALLLLVSGCQVASEPTTGDAGSPQAETGMIPNEAATAAPDLARIRSAMRPLLPDAATAQFEEMRSVPGGAVCGRVRTSAQGGPADPRLFVIAPDGAALMSRSPELALEDPSDPFPDAYIRWCASIEELRQLQVAMEGLSRAAPEMVENSAPPNENEPLEGRAATSPPFPVLAPNRRHERADETFENAVRRFP